MKILLAGLTTLLLTTPAAAQERSGPPADRGGPAQADMPLDPAVVTGSFPNGLRYYIRKNDRPKARAELRLVVNAGSVLEDDDQLGLAHFVEHMAFNGTARFAKQSLVDYIEAIGMRFGADLNASTSFDETIYQLLVPTDSTHLLTRGFDILEDWAHGITFDTAEVRKERGVVIEEWRLGQGASNRMFEKQMPVIFRGSRYKDRLPIGTKQSLETFDPAALTRYYRDWYRPDLMAVIAVGDFDVEQVRRLISERFSRLRPATTTPRQRVAYRIPARDSSAAAIATDKEATGTQVGIYYLRPDQGDLTVTAYRASLVEQLYSQMLNQRLYELSQQPNPPFIGAGGGGGSFIRGTDAFSLGAAVADTGILRGFEAVVTEVERVDRHGFTPAEFDRTKRDFLRSYEQAYAERDKTESGSYVEQYIRHFLTREPSPGIEYEYQLTQRLLPTITLAEVNAAARDWLAVRDRILLVNAPDKVASRIPGENQLLGVFDLVKRADVAAYAETVSEAPLVAADLPPRPPVSETTDPNLGITTWVLPNGVRVIAKPTDFKADEVLLSATSPGGSSVEPDSLFLAAVFSSQAVALGGAGDFSAVELQKKLAGKAVFVSPFVGSYQEGFRGQASPKDLETLFQLVYLNFTAPRRDPEAFAAFRTNIRAALANRSASPDVAFRDTLSVTLTQHHPRNQPVSTATIDSLDLDRALAVYRDRFADASDFTFVLVGAFSLDSLKPLVARYLGNLPATRRGESWKDVGMRNPRGIVEREVRRGVEPKSRTELVFNGEFPYSRAERFVLRSMADILDIKLRESLREDLGGTYGVSVSPSPTRIPREEYTLSIRFESAPDRVDQLVAAVFAQVDTLATRGPDDKDLAKIRETVIRSRETDLRENGFWLGQLAGYAANGEDPAGIVKLDDLLPLLTRERIRAAAARYLDKKNYIRVTLMPERSTQPD
ncbi:MAG: insulinase family protein [Gemmatimonadales bacterium]